MPICVTIKRKLQHWQQQRLSMTRAELQSETAILSDTTSNATDDIQSTAGLEENTVIRVPNHDNSGQIRQSATTVAEQMTVAGQPPPSEMLLAGINII